MPKLTGTDISIRECRESGYAVIHHTGRFNPDKLYRLTISNPHQWPWGVNKIGVSSDALYVTDTLVSYNGLLEILHKSKGLQEYADVANRPFATPSEADFMDLASLAGVVSSYQYL